eukprot:706437-Ditylum_brightwellii.AAC.1
MDVNRLLGNMQLAVNLDAAYLVLSGAKSQLAGHFYLESLPNSLNYNSAQTTPQFTQSARQLNLWCALQQKQSAVIPSKMARLPLSSAVSSKNW